MSRQREKKEQVVAGIREKLGGSVASILVDYRGLKVKEMDDLRGQLREAGVEFHVTKDTLAWRAARELGLADLEPYLKGPTAIAFSPRDPVAPAKILTNFARDHKVMELKGAVLEGKILTREQVEDLAKLPGREELLARVLGGMQAPLAGTVGVLAALLRNFVYALDQIRAQKEAA